MVKYDNTRALLEQLYKFLEEGQEIGFENGELLDKLKKVVEDRETIRIVLLGAVSDGKTSTVAGMLGRVESSMKIDSDESSDELKVYRPDGLKQGFEIVDTPGLFGTKEKEVDGKNIKLSEITDKYLSEAHIVIYVSDAGNPLKESHEEQLKYVLRKLNKLDSSIFVLNKMDEAGFDLLDEEDFNEGVMIKTDVMTNRLTNVLSLTEEEKNKLRIVCIAANPKGKKEGLSYWMQKPDDYKRRSHIEALTTQVNNVAESSNQEILISAAGISVIKDLTRKTLGFLSVKTSEMGVKLEEINSDIKDISKKYDTLKEKVLENRKIMSKQIEDYRKKVILDINSCSTLNEFTTYLVTDLGYVEKEKELVIFSNKINQILSESTEKNSRCFENAQADLNDVLNKLNGKLAEYAMGGLGKIAGKINPAFVKGVRDFIAPGFKFKPYQAIKFAKIGGAVIAGLFEIIGVVYRLIEIYKLDKAKKDTIKAIDDVFTSVFKLFGEDDVYYDNFAPALLTLRKTKNKLEQTSVSLNSDYNAVQGYKSRFSVWYKQNIEDIEFEDF